MTHSIDWGLKDKVAIVTGGSEGIGLASALRLVQAGAKVVICGRSQAKLEAALGALGPLAESVKAVTADVSQPASIESLVNQTIAWAGGIDILVNNAGTANRGAFESLSDAFWQADFDLKLFAAVRLSRLVVPLMRARGGGRIINVTNIGAKSPREGTMPTTVTRAAGLAMTKALSRELAPDQILVNAVCIGLIKAGQHAARAQRESKDLEALYAAMAKDIPIGRVGEAVEAANVIVFLASSLASYVTGTSINIDGGSAAVL